MSTAVCRTAVFCQDKWHPAAQIRSGFEAWIPKRFVFDFLDTPDSWRTPLSSYDLVVLAKGNTTAPDDASPWLSPDREDDFDKFVRTGKGLFCLHGGVCYGASPRLRSLIGGAFLQHPPPCDIRAEPVSGHAIVAAAPAFDVFDEHYFVALDDREANVFLETSSSHGTQPAGWAREVGSGRVCALTLGHCSEVWANPGFQALAIRSLEWASRAPLYTNPARPN